MNSDIPEKDESITILLEKLYDSLGRNTFVIVDHWQDDLTAIGIGSPKNKEVLVYISTYGKKDGSYDIDLELPPQPDESQLPYSDGGQFKAVGFYKLLELIRNHLN